MDVHLLVKPGDVDFKWRSKIYALGICFGQILAKIHTGKKFYLSYRMVMQNSLTQLCLIKTETVTAMIEAQTMNWPYAAGTVIGMDSLCCRSSVRLSLHKKTLKDES